MKKILGILIISLFSSTSVLAFSVHDYIKEGISKKEFKKKIELFGFLKYKKSFEIKKVISEHGNNFSGVFYGSVYREYFPEYNVEILSHWYKGQLETPENNFPYYIFENVTEPVTCTGSFICSGSIGNGTLKKVVFSKTEAFIEADPVFAKKIEDEKKRKEEEKRIAEKKKKDSREAVDLAATLYYWVLSTDKISMYFFGNRYQNNLKGTMKIIDENYLPWHGIFGISVKDYEKFDITAKTKSGTILEFTAKNSNKQKIKLNFDNRTAILIDSAGNKSSLRLNKPEKLFAANTFDVDKPDEKKPKKKKPNDDKIVPAGSGSGFFVSSNGTVITNHHVIEGCEVNKVSHKGSQYEAKVLAVDKVNDIAILKTSIRPDRVFPVSNEDVSLLEDVVVAGYPLGKQVSSAIKTHKGVVTALAGAGDNYSNFQTDAPINQGNSGGPILDQKGNVVGIAVATWVEEGVQGVHFGIKSSTLKTFASANGLKFLPANNRDLSNKDLGKLSMQSTVYVECHMTVAKIKKMIAEAENKKAFFKEFE